MNRAALRIPEGYQLGTATLADVLAISGLIFMADPSIAASVNTGTPANNDPVSNWNDQSASANHLTSSGSNRFIYKTNIFGSNPGMQSQRANFTFMQFTNDIVGLTDFTIIALVKLTEPAAIMAIAYHNSGTNGHTFGSVPLYLNYSSGSVVECWDGTNGGANYKDFPHPYAPTNKTLLYEVKGNSAPANASLRINNRVIPSAGGGGSVWDMQMATISHNGSLCVDGYFGPVIIFNRSLTNSESQTILNYLNAGGWFR